MRTLGLWLWAVAVAVGPLLLVATLRTALLLAVLAPVALLALWAVVAALQPVVALLMALFVGATFVALRYLFLVFSKLCL